MPRATKKGLEIETNIKQWITKKVVEAPRKEEEKKDERRACMAE
jgi:hypothetical protein